MVCQARHQAMPFNLPDGSPYFELPELLAGAIGDGAIVELCSVVDAHPLMGRSEAGRSCTSERAA